MPSIPHLLDSWNHTDIVLVIIICIREKPFHYISFHCVAQKKTKTDEFKQHPVQKVHVCITVQERTTKK